MNHEANIDKARSSSDADLYEKAQGTFTPAQEAEYSKHYNFADAFPMQALSDICDRYGDKSEIEYNERLQSVLGSILDGGTVEEMGTRVAKQLHAISTEYARAEMGLETEQ